MDLNDLWIGDTVKVISTGEIGKYEGEDSHGQAKVRFGREIKMIGALDLIIEEEEEDFKKQNKKIKKGKEFNFEILEMAGFNRVLDLHLDKLKDFEASNWPLGPIDFQLHHCRKYIKEAIRNRVPRIEIIHGKGKGVLKEEVMSLLFVFEEVQSVDQLANEGKLEVWFEYD